MSKLFIKKKKRFSSGGVLLSVFFFGALIALFIWGLGDLSQRTQAEQLNSAQKAVTRAAVQCYAVEGQYPPSIAYLREHYGLSVDTERYIVEYRAFASNIMPTITVLPRDFDSVENEGLMIIED